MLIVDLPKNDFKSIFLKYSQSPQGIYLMEGFSTNVGVLPYTIEKNNTTYATGILTSDTELFNPKSLDSLIGVAVVKEHPKDFNADIKDMGGIVLSATPSYNDDNYDISSSASTWGLRLKIAVWGEELLSYISQGNTEISAGYTADIIEKEGTWYGSPYTIVKENILYNHLAIVESGSARNGSKSALISDHNILTFQIISESTRKLTDSITLVLPESVQPNHADIKNTPGIIEDDTVDIINAHMKSLVLPNKKIIELSDDIYQEISDTINNLIREKQNAESEANQAKTVAEKASSEIEDSKSKTQELTQKIKESSSKLSRNVAIAAKAEKLKVKVNYDEFDPISTMREALGGKFPGVETIGEETLNYLFNLAEIPKESAPVDDVSEPEGTSSEVKDSINSDIKKSVRNERKTDTVTSEELSAHMADRRRTRSK